MQISLSPEVQKEIEHWVQSGHYQTPEDVITAALASLQQQERFGDFAPGELDDLLADAENDIANGHVVDGDMFFAELRRMSAEWRGGAK